MAGESKPVIGTDLESISPAFLNRLATLRGRDIADVIGLLSSKRSVDHTLGQQPRACVIDGFDVSAQIVPGMTLQVGLGVGYVPASGTTGVVGSPQTLEDSNVVMLNKRTLSAAVAIGAADPSLDRWDLIEVKATATPATVGVDDSETVMLWSDAINDFVASSTPRAVMTHGEPDVIVTPGTPGANLVPATTAGRIPIAVVRVPAAATAITQGLILDVRQYLSDLAQAQADAPSWLDVEEFIIDTAASTPLIAIRANGRIKGVPFAIRTDAPLAYNASLMLDPNSSLAGVTGWIYVYAVAQDDKGYRYSRSRVTNAVDSLVSAGGDFSHCGLFVISTTAPSLTNGSLAPSSSIKTPLAYGSSVAGLSGTGRVMCIGCFYMNSGSFVGGLRMVRGKAEIQAYATAPALALSTGATPTWVTETAQVSALYADFAATGNPQGPVAYDVSAIFPCDNANDASAARLIQAFAKNAASTTTTTLLAATTDRVAAAGMSYTNGHLVVRDVPVARFPENRGTTRDGFYLKSIVTAAGAISGTGHGFTNPATSAPTFLLVGYRWPQGAVQV